MEISSEYTFPIFISSTDYNLIDLRAELAHHLTDIGYRPILSSADGFPDRSPELEPWESCLPVLEGCFVIVLVIDGRYGTGFDWPHFKHCFDDRKLSPTHAEYAYAHKLKKRMLVFIRDDVLSHYQSYRTAIAKANGDAEKAREFLANTLPSRIAFETLQFIEEVKTSKPIPWINSFADVTSVKREIQKKMLNELAEVFMIKNRHLETVFNAFSKAIDELGPEKRKEVLQSIGATRELMEEIEAKSKVVQGLRDEERRLNTELEKARQEIEQGKKSKEEKAALEARVKKLTEETNRLRREIVEREQANTSFILGRGGRAGAGGGEFLSPSHSSSGFPVVTGSVGVFGEGIASNYVTGLGLGAVQICAGCGKSDLTRGLFGFTQCPKCGNYYCMSCWPYPDRFASFAEDTCPKCKAG